FAPFTVTTHAPVPVQSPVQPVNVQPGFGVAVSVTTVPWPNGSLQSPGQLMPAGVLVMTPEPLAGGETLEGYWLRVKVGVTVSGSPTVTTHAPVPVQSPVQPVKLQPVAGVAVSVTTVP